MPIPASHAPNVPCLSFDLLESLSRRIEILTGQYFPLERFQDLNRNVCACARDFGYSDIETFARWLLAASLTENQVKTLAAYFTVGETYFFRDSRMFTALRETVVPRILARCAREGGKIRIWSAGCSSGEEPYSIAILLADMIAGIGNLDISILATDINGSVLEKAKQGIYRTWSLRMTNQIQKARWFTQKGDLFILSPKIREMVVFTYLNLMDDIYQAMSNSINNMDLIVCRNVMMYFSKDQASRVLRKLAKSLRDDGILVLGSVEAGIPETGADLVSVPLPGICAFQKKQREKTTPEPVPRAYVTWPGAAGSYGQACLTVPEKRKTQAPQIDARNTEPPPVALDRIKFIADRGRVDQALEMCEKSLKTDLFNASLHYLKATFLQELNRPKEAISALQQTLYLDQNFLMAHFSLGLLLRASGRVSAAEVHLATVRRLLEKYQENDILPQAEGMCAGELMRLASKSEKVQL